MSRLIRRVRAEDGQALPLMLGLLVALIAAAVLVFQLVLSTSLAARAQTAADAAALAGENDVVSQLDQAQPGTSIDSAEVQTAAEQYAQRNGGTILGNVQVIPSTAGDDVLVTVETTQGLPSRSVDAGARAVREARASTDPYGGAAAGATAAASIPTDASNPTGSFVPHGGQYGFFPDPGTNYTVGSEGQIATDLDQMGKALHLHLTGISGYRTPAHSVAVGGTADDPHTCGAASDTGGAQTIPEATLQRFGLTRPFPNLPSEADHIQLTQTNGSVCVNAGASGGAASEVSIGNPAPHLVPLSGGPEGMTAVGTVTASIGPSGSWAIPWAVVNCESGGHDDPPNSATASGYYQIENGTWAGYGGYPSAWMAPKSVQDQKAAQLLQTRGLEPWTASEPCWGPIIGFRA